MGVRPLTRDLAQYLVDLQYEDLAPTTVKAAKEAVLGQPGIMVIGSTLPWTQPSHDVISELASKPESTIIGHATKVCAPDAAFVNANFGHSCELDDSGPPGGGHPGSLTV